MVHAETHFHSTKKGVSYGSTEVFRLGKAIYSIVVSVIEGARHQNTQNEINRSSVQVPEDSTT